MGPTFGSLCTLFVSVCDLLHVLTSFGDGGQEIVQTSDVRVSDRVPQQSLKLHSFKPLYNEISGEVKDIYTSSYCIATTFSGDF